MRAGIESKRDRVTTMTAELHKKNMDRLSHTERATVDSIKAALLANGPRVDGDTPAKGCINSVTIGGQTFKVTTPGTSAGWWRDELGGQTSKTADQIPGLTTGELGPDESPRAFSPVMHVHDEVEVNVHRLGAAAGSSFAKYELECIKRSARSCGVPVPGDKIAAELEQLKCRVRACAPATVWDGFVKDAQSQPCPMVDSIEAGLKRYMDADDDASVRVDFTRSASATHIGSCYGATVYQNGEFSEFGPALVIAIATRIGCTDLDVRERLTGCARAAKGNRADFSRGSDGRCYVLGAGADQIMCALAERVELGDETVRVGFRPTGCTGTIYVTTGDHAAYFRHGEFTTDGQPLIQGLAKRIGCHAEDVGVRLIDCARADAVERVAEFSRGNNGRCYVQPAEERPVHRSTPERVELGTVEWDGERAFFRDGPNGYCVSVHPTEFTRDGRASFAESYGVSADQMTKFVEGVARWPKGGKRTVVRKGGTLVRAALPADSEARRVAFTMKRVAGECHCFSIAGSHDDAYTAPGGGSTQGLMQFASAIHSEHRDAIVVSLVSFAACHPDATDGQIKVDECGTVEVLEVVQLPLVVSFEQQDHGWRVSSDTVTSFMCVGDAGVVGGEYHKLVEELSVKLGVSKVDTRCALRSTVRELILGDLSRFSVAKSPEGECVFTRI